MSFLLPLLRSRRDLFPGEASRSLSMRSADDLADLRSKVGLALEETHYDDVKRHFAQALKFLDAAEAIMGATTTLDAIGFTGRLIKHASKPIEIGDAERLRMNGLRSVRKATKEELRRILDVTATELLKDVLNGHHLPPGASFARTRAAFGMEPGRQAGDLRWKRADRRRSVAAGLADDLCLGPLSEVMDSLTKYHPGLGFGTPWHGATDAWSGVVRIPIFRAAVRFNIIVRYDLVAGRSTTSIGDVHAPDLVHAACERSNLDRILDLHVPPEYDDGAFRVIRRMRADPDLHTLNMERYDGGRIGLAATRATPIPVRLLERLGEIADEEEVTLTMAPHGLWSPLPELVEAGFCWAEIRDEHTMTRTPRSSWAAGEDRPLR